MESELFGAIRESARVNRHAREVACDAWRRSYRRGILLVGGSCVAKQRRGYR